MQKCVPCPNESGSHELHLALHERLIQKRVDDVLNARAQPLDHVWRKLLVQQFAQAAMIRRIEKEHPFGKDLVER